jgi:GT2 family glycosyltransferase
MIADQTAHTEVSVVVPFYTGLRELELTLAGLDAQAAGTPSFEVIIAEDGSPSSPRALARSFENLQVRFARIDRDGFRLATVRNEAVLRARSFILLLDFDCVPTPAHVLTHYRALESNPLAVTIGLRRFVYADRLRRHAITSGDRWWDDLDDIESISNPGFVFDKRVGLVEKISELPFPCNLFHGCNVGFRRSAAVRVGMFDERFNGAHGYEDIEFAYRLQRHGAEFVFVDAPVFHLENEVVNVSARRSGRERNLPLLGQLCPDLVAHRDTLGREVP